MVSGGGDGFVIVWKVTLVPEPNLEEVNRFDPDQDGPPLGCPFLPIAQHFSYISPSFPQHFSYISPSFPQHFSYISYSILHHKTTRLVIRRMLVHA